MTQQALRDICEATTAVRGPHVALLDCVAARLPFLADLAGADLTLFAAAPEPPGLVVLAEGRPTACRSLYGKPRQGEILPPEAEPVVDRCLRTGRAQRRGFASLTGGHPVEQAVLPVQPPGGAVLAALSAERSLLNGPWAVSARPLRQAAADLADTLLGRAVRPRDLEWLLRMAQGLALTEPTGRVVYADSAAQRLWQKALPDGHLTRHLPQGPAPEATVISRRDESWGREWEFGVGNTVLRRRDIPLRPGSEGSPVLTLLQDVSHLHARELLVSARSAAIQEIHHRIKNNLQTISSLLRMQARRETSPQTVESLRTAIGRVLSVALVHEALSREGADEVDLKALATTLVEAAIHGAQRDGPPLTYAVLGPRLMLPAAKASQVALVLNELIQNAVKHAFPGDRSGGITIWFEPSPEAVTVTVRDDGVGLPPGFRLDRSTTLGLQITQRIVESDLGGTLKLIQDGGTTVAMQLPTILVHGELGTR